MSFIDRNLNQTVTSWGPATPDGFGGASYTAPVTIKARWEDKSELFVNDVGQESKSQSVVYVNKDLALKGYLFLGISTATDPTTVVGAKEIRGVRKTPALGALIFERKVLL